MKKRFLALFLAVLGIAFVSTNSTFAMDPHQPSGVKTNVVTACTSYCPCNVATNAIDLWALQPRKAPWCFDSCMKIVLRDVKEKNRVSSLPWINTAQIDMIVNASVPEEEIVHKVLLDNHAIGEVQTINDAEDIYRDDFFSHATNFFNYYLKDEISNNRIAIADINRKVNLLNGMLGFALDHELNDLWRKLDANTRKMIVQESAQAVLYRIQKDTGIVGNIHNINVTATTKDLGEYNAALYTIVNEIEANKRMVVLFFENADDHSKSHACVAYATKRINIQSKEKLEIKVFNPWGNPITMNSDNEGPLFDLNNAPGVPGTWLLNKYVTFNY